MRNETQLLNVTECRMEAVIMNFEPLNKSLTHYDLKHGHPYTDLDFAGLSISSYELFT
jgi:hypothetical protein